MYEHWLGEPKIVPSKLTKPRDVGHLLCRHYLNNEFDRAEMIAAGGRVLRDHLESDWLDRGQLLTAAMWLTLVHWYPAFHDGAELPDPVEVLLEAYEDMPNVTRPF